MKPELIFLILILIAALLIGSGLKKFGSELLKGSAQKIEKVNVSLVAEKRS